VQALTDADVDADEAVDAVDANASHAKEAQDAEQDAEEASGTTSASTSAPSSSSDNGASFDYLISMRISSFTTDNVYKCEQELTSVNDQLVALQNDSIESMWIRELYALREKYEQNVAAMCAYMLKEREDADKKRKSNTGANGSAGMRSGGGGAPKKRRRLAAPSK
jgi:uncharacterized membrane protein YgcG